MVGQSDRPAPGDPAVVGIAVRPHGLAGDIVVAPADPRSTYFEPGNVLWVGGGWRRLLEARVQRDRWIVKVEGVTDRDAAEALRGEELLVEADELPELAGDRYYVHDLVGCRVEDTAGADLGEIVGVVPGAQDWLEIRSDAGSSLVPMVRAMLKEIDIDRRRVVIDPPAGLVEATRA